MPACLAGLLLVAPFAAAEPDAGSRAFGFTGPEIFPIDNLISHIRSADFDGDGRLDLVVVNNSRSKLNLLFNRTGDTNLVETPREGRDINALPPDARFRLESIASEKRITALVVADLNHDQRPDLAYYGEPKELVIQYREGGNDWSAPRRWPINDGLLDMNALDYGDLNGDHLDDLVLLGESVIYILLQKEDGGLAEPERLPYSGTVRAVQVLDVDGDARQDLMLVNWDLANPFRFRLQGTDGSLGPEIHFTLPAIRSYWPDDLDGDGRTEVVTIAQKSGRAQISNFVRKPGAQLDSGVPVGQFQVLPLTKTSKSKRGVIWADVTGDGLQDLLVAEPDSGQLSLNAQTAAGELGSVRRFPTFTGVTELQAGDWDGDGRMEIFLLSSDERQVGVTRYEAEGRIGFPTLLALDGRPLAMAVGSLVADQPPVLAAVVERERRRELVLWGPKGEVRRQALDEAFKANADALRLHDLDQDGRLDLVVLIPYEKLKVLRQKEDGSFDELDLAAPGGSSELPALSAGDVDNDGRPELLLAQKNFVRAVVLQAEATGADAARAWSFRVKEQINGVSSASRITAATSVRLGAERTPALLLLDAERNAVSICQQDQAGVWQIARNVNLPVSDFTQLEPINLGAERTTAAAFLGLNGVAWLPFAGDAWELVELDDYETPIQDGFLHDVVSGDLNNDGRRDLVFLETGRHYLDLVTFEPPHDLVPASRWQVFEERTFRNRRAEIPEPREALIIDVTGDGRNDLVVVVHDRVLLYPQE